MKTDRINKVIKTLEERKEEMYKKRRELTDDKVAKELLVTKILTYYHDNGRISETRTCFADSGRLYGDWHQYREDGSLFKLRRFDKNSELIEYIEFNRREIAVFKKTKDEILLDMRIEDYYFSTGEPFRTNTGEEYYTTAEFLKVHPDGFY